MEIDKQLQQKYQKLRNIIQNMGSAVIAFSGGIDSTLLVAVTHEVLSDKMVAVTGVSPTYPAHDHHDALEIAKSLDVRHETIQTSEFTDPEFPNNPPHRCYLCKQYLLRDLIKIAQREEFAGVFEGSNADDTNDYRPGIKAARDLNVRSPLMEAGFTKQDIRDLARAKGLPLWGKPASACLASRIPYGQKITLEKLKKIEAAETALRSLHFKIIRVRDNESLALIELGQDELKRVFEPGIREKIIDSLKKAGYQRISVDLEGYRSGSMNETLSQNEK